MTSWEQMLCVYTYTWITEWMCIISDFKIKHEDQGVFVRGSLHLITIETLDSLRSTVTANASFCIVSMVINMDKYMYRSSQIAMHRIFGQSLHAKFQVSLFSDHVMWWRWWNSRDDNSGNGTLYYIRAMPCLSWGDRMIEVHVEFQLFHVFVLVWWMSVPDWHPYVSIQGHSGVSHTLYTNTSRGNITTCLCLSVWPTLLVLYITDILS